MKPHYVLSAPTNSIQDVWYAGYAMTVRMVISVTVVVQGYVRGFYQRRVQGIRG